jgi:hypothetical protein
MGGTATTTGIGLAYEFEFHAGLKPPVEAGAGPYGTRVFFEVTGGEVTGERVSGQVLPGGGDWLLVGPDGWGRLDVRAQLRTHDGACIYMSYSGVLELNDVVQRAAATGGETRWEDQYYRVTPQFETGDARYAWLHQAVFVGEGRIFPGGGVAYRVHRVT